MNREENRRAWKWTKQEGKTKHNKTKQNKNNSKLTKKKKKKKKGFPELKKPRWIP